MLPPTPDPCANQRPRKWFFAYRLPRAAALFGALLLAAGCAANATRPPSTVLTQPQPPSTQSALQHILLARKAAGQDPVLAFYQKRDFAPAWTGGLQEEAMAAQLGAVLSHADEQGLRSEDYMVPRSGVRPMPGAKAAEYDLALTAAALRYSCDVKTGRVTPSDIYEDAELPASRFDAVAGLTRALSENRLAAYLADLPPSHPQYRGLVKALARYRAIVAEGGWPVIPDEKEIKLEGKDGRVSLLVKRLASEDPILAAIANPSAAELRDAVKRYQARNGLDQDGRVSRETLAVLNVPAVFRVAEIAANMERWRWLLPQLESRYVEVNVPDQSVEFVRDGTVALKSRAIVGRKSSPTPITVSAITAVVVNPPWNIPGDIAARDLLPQLRRNPNYLAARNMVVMDGPPGDPHGRTIDWRKIIPAEFPYAIRQLPGPNTALGTLMLDSPNDFDVYLHDTPAKKRFESSEREISNGCVRVQEIFPLASLALSGDPVKSLGKLAEAVKTGHTQRQELSRPLPVYFLYWTALADDDGKVEFRRDIYGRDAPLIAALTKQTRGVAMDGVRASADQSPMDGDELGP